jgi:hypothetical protein
MPNRFDLITNYLVVPLIGGAGERTVTCRYFLKKNDGWTPVDPDKLNSNLQDVVCIRQPPYEEAVKIVPDADRCLHLFAGVAKTRNGSHAMPSLMPVDDGAIIVALYPESVRSLILIFQRVISNSEYGELVATTDPEVRNDVVNPGQ